MVQAADETKSPAQDTAYYTGEFCLDEATGKPLYHGTGILKQAEFTYRGEFCRGEQQGFGTFVWTQGDTYTGQCHASFRHGHGVYRWVDGSYYSGGYVKNKREGYAIYYSHKDCTLYKGELKAGKRHGHGSMCFHNGDYYEGNFVDNRPNGKGWMKLAQDEPIIYEGEFLNGRFHGTGTLRWLQRSAYYVGQWQHHRRCGKGELHLMMYGPCNAQEELIVAQEWQETSSLNPRDMGYIPPITSTALRRQSPLSPSPLQNEDQQHQHSTVTTPPGSPNLLLASSAAAVTCHSRADVRVLSVRHVTMEEADASAPAADVSLHGLEEEAEEALAQNSDITMDDPELVNIFDQTQQQQQQRREVPVQRSFLHMDSSVTDNEAEEENDNNDNTENTPPPRLNRSRSLSLTTATSSYSSSSSSFSYASSRSRSNSPRTVALNNNSSAAAPISPPRRAPSTQPTNHKRQNHNLLMYMR